MYIKTQDGNAIYNVDQILSIKMDGTSIEVLTECDYFYTIGHYDEQKAKQVFDMIINFMRTGYGSDIFIMPQ